MENNFEYLKNEVKNLISIKKEENKNNIENNLNNKNINQNINPKETINFNLNQSNDLLELTKKYSIEIYKLKKQNEIIINIIQTQNQNINLNSNKNNLLISKNFCDSTINNF